MAVEGRKQGANSRASEKVESRGFNSNFAGSTEHLPGFWLDSSNAAIRKCRWRNEFYEGSNRFYMGQITLEVLVGHSVKDLQ